MSGMWLDRTFRNEFIMLLFGEMPDLGEIEVTSIKIERDGPALNLCFASMVLPKNPPKKWPLFNTVYYDITYYDFSTIQTLKVDPQGLARISVAQNKVIISGAFSMSFECDFCVINRITPFNFK